MFKKIDRRTLGLGIMSAALLFAGAATAEKKYDPGASDTEIVIGQTAAFSGPASAYSAIAKSQAAYFDMVNDRGGVNGRKIRLIALDDAYSPPKTVEQVRKLVENENVFLIFSILGTPPNAAVQKYLNARKVPQLFAATGASRFQDPKNYPWTLAFNPNYQSEARVYGQYIAKNLPGKKVGVIYANDDLGKDYLVGIKEGLGEGSTQLVAALPYEVTDTSVDAQILKLKSLGVEAFLNISTPKFAAQAIKRAAELDWKPVQFLTLNSNSITGVLAPAGLEASKGIMTVSYLKEPQSLGLENDKGIQDYVAFMKKYYPDGDPNNFFNVYGYAIAELMTKVLADSGDELTRENVMKKATSLNKVATSMHHPGLTMTTTPDDYRMQKQFYMTRFNGAHWENFGDLIEDKASSSSK